MTDAAPKPGGDATAPDNSEQASKDGRKQKKENSLWREIPILIAVALVLSFLLRTFIAQVYVIPSESMEPTLHGCAGCTGDRIVVQKLSYDFHSPKQGDVVVFVGPTSSWNASYESTRSPNLMVRGFQNTMSVFGLVPPDENDLVKRVIATGGHRVQCCDAQGRVMVDGKPLDESYVVNDFTFTPGVRDCTTMQKSRRCFDPVTVPEGNIWVMGDNRCQSADSRFHVEDELQGTVPENKVRGKVAFRIWPPNRIGGIGSPGTPEGGPKPCSPGE